MDFDLFYLNITGLSFCDRQKGILQIVVEIKLYYIKLKLHVCTSKVMAYEICTHSSYIQIYGILLTFRLSVLKLGRERS